MKLKKLREEYETTMEHGFSDKKKKKKYDIFTNPTPKEMKAVARENKNTLRWIANLENKKLYIFNASLLHEYACNELEVKYNGNNTRKAAFGIGTYMERKILVNNKENIKVIKQNPWMKRYMII